MNYSNNITYWDLVEARRKDVKRYEEMFYSMSEKDQLKFIVDFNIHGEIWKCDYCGKWAKEKEARCDYCGAPKRS